MIIEIGQSRQKSIKGKDFIRKQEVASSCLQYVLTATHLYPYHFPKITAFDVGLTRTEKSTLYIILSRNCPQEAQTLFKSAKKLLFLLIFHTAHLLMIRRENTEEQIRLSNTALIFANRHGEMAFVLLLVLLRPEILNL